MGSTALQIAGLLQRIVNFIKGRAERQDRSAFNRHIFSHGSWRVHGDFGNADLLNFEPAAPPVYVAPDAAGAAARRPCRTWASEIDPAAG